MRLALNATVLGDILGDITINNQATVSSHGLILLTGVLGEAPFLGDDDLLAAGELHSTSSHYRERSTYSALRRASRTAGAQASVERTEMMGSPMLTRATRPSGLPKECLIPV